MTSAAGHAAKSRPVALVTGASRRINIGAAVARNLATEGWDIALTYWRPYDGRMPWGSTPSEVDELVHDLESLGATATAMEADLEDAGTADRVVSNAVARLGPITALIMSHCESVDSAIHDTSIESFDRHFAVNARASWLLIKAFAERCEAAPEELHNGSSLTLRSPEMNCAARAADSHWLK